MEAQPIQSAAPWSEISMGSISVSLTFSKRSCSAKKRLAAESGPGCIRGTLRVGQGNQQDVLKAQLQHTKILQEIAHHHQEEDCWKPRSSSSWAVRKSPQTSLPKPSWCDLFLTPQPNFSSEPGPESRRALKKRVHPTAGNSGRTGTQEFRPDFNVQYTYEHTGSQARDYYMATFGIRLPNRGRQKAELAEAKQNQERARQELDAEKKKKN